MKLGRKNASFENVKELAQYIVSEATFNQVKTNWVDGKLTVVKQEEEYDLSKLEIYAIDKLILDINKIKTQRGMKKLYATLVGKYQKITIRRK